MLIVGRRGSGKDALAHRFAQIRHQETHKKVVVHLDPKKYKLPNYYKEFEEKPEQESNTIQILSDAHLYLYAREWHDDFNKSMDKLQTVSRHKDIDFIYTTQQTSRMDRNIVAGVDAIIFREPSFLQARMTRPEIRSLVEEAIPHFQDAKGKPLGQREKWKRAVVFTHAGTMKTLVKDIQLPYYWSGKLSKIYGEAPMTEEESERRLVIKRK